MKCPNCSFNNQAGDLTCKICDTQLELNSELSTDTVSLDNALKEMFGKEASDLPSWEPLDSKEEPREIPIEDLPKPTPESEPSLEPAQEVSKPSMAQLEPAEEPEEASISDTQEIMSDTIIPIPQFSEPEPETDPEPELEPETDPEPEPEPDIPVIDEKYSKFLPDAPILDSNEKENQDQYSQQLFEDNTEKESEIDEFMNRNDTKPKKRLNIIIIFLLVILLILLSIFIYKLINNWRENKNPTETTTTAASSESSKYDTKGINATVNKFFYDLELYFTQNDNSVLTQFLNPIEAAKKLGELRDLDVLSLLSDIEITPNEDGTATVKTVVTNLEGDKAYQRDVNWKISLEESKKPEDNNKLVVKEFSHDFTLENDSTVKEQIKYETTTVTVNEDSTESDTTQTTTQITSTETTTKTTTTEPTTESADYSGYITTGGFRGGNSSVKNLSLDSIRYGRHAHYQRIVLDFGPDSAEGIPSYNANMSSAGKKIEITVRGIDSSDAVINLPSWLAAESADLQILDGEIKITIMLSNSSQYRIFGLDNPARIVIDFANQ